MKNIQTSLWSGLICVRNIQSNTNHTPLIDLCQKYRTPNQSHLAAVVPEYLHVIIHHLDSETFQASLGSEKVFVRNIQPTNDHIPLPHRWSLLGTSREAATEDLPTDRLRRAERSRKYASNLSATNAMCDANPNPHSHA
ncbi:hypothetical protein J6590_047637 [Homalodisca vitripennis]|nr:hypothetical protein J6590_047637 [Homalodisca vitripennis]